MRRLLGSSLALLLAACAPLPPEGPAARQPGAPRVDEKKPDDTARRDIDGHPMQPFDASQVPDAVPEHAPRSRYGNPPSYEVFGKRYHVMKDAAGFRERGIASWYGTKFHGQRTSSGERYDMYLMTAAHKTLPLPSWVRVTNLENRRSVVVKVNDRGPFHDNRIIDLSYSAAQRLGIVGKGTGLVEIRVLEPGASLESTGVPQDETVAKPVAPRVEDAGAPAVTAGIADAPLGPAVATPQMYLQVGAFTEDQNARALALRLEAAGIPVAAVIQAGDDGRRFHKVRVGPFATVDEVDAVTAKLATLGLKDPQLVIP